MFPIGLLTRALFRVIARRWRQGPQRPNWSLPIEVANELARMHLYDIGRLPPAAGRKMQEDFIQSVPSRALRKVTIHPARIGGIEGEWMQPRDREPAPVLLYFHGGGYVVGSVKTHRDVVARFILPAHMRAFSPSYRLAPEHPYPAAVEDAVAVYEGLCAENIAPQKIIVGGDSAGGGLALALLLRLRAAGRPQPAGALLISPWVDLTCSAQSVEDNARYDYGDRSILELWASMYRGSASAKDPLISPLNADLSQLPPLCVFVGEAELLVDEVKAFVKNARAAKVPVDFVCAADMTHDYPLVQMFAPATAEAFKLAAQFMLAKTNS